MGIDLQTDLRVSENWGYLILGSLMTTVEPLGRASREEPRDEGLAA